MNKTDSKKPPKFDAKNDDLASLFGLPGTQDINADGLSITIPLTEKTKNILLIAAQFAKCRPRTLVRMAMENLLGQPLLSIMKFSNDRRAKPLKRRAPARGKVPPATAA